MDMSKLVVFSHGMESGPWGTKIKALAEVAKQCGYAVESIDYQGIADPDERVKKLLAHQPQAETLVLLGASMGAYVSAVAAEYLNVSGLFLLAPAFYMPIGQQQNPPACAQLTRVIHGWQDDVVPVEHAIRYAQDHGVALELLQDGHRLIDVLPQIKVSFANFLTRAE
jgi:alpha/beta superfamily hydrolase